MLKCFDHFLTLKQLSRVFVVFLAFFILVSAKLINPFTDKVDEYHQGELMGNYWHMLAFYKGEVDFPFLIHGAMDYIPSLMGGWLFGDDHIIFGTRLIIVLLTIFSWSAFLFLSITILAKKDDNTAIPLCLIFMFSLILPLTNLSIYRIEETPPGLRDIIVILQVYLLYSYFLTSPRKKFLFFAFFLLPVALYWSYDRGIASCLGCFAILLFFLFKKRYYELFLSTFTLISSFILFEAIHIFGSLLENGNVIQYWTLASAEIFQTPWVQPPWEWKKMSVLAFPLPIFFFIFTLCLCYSNRHKLNLDFLPLIIFIIVFELILLKSAYNRPSLQRGLTAIWPSILLFLIMLEARVNLKITFHKKLVNDGKDDFFFKIAALCLIFSVFIFSGLLSKVYFLKKNLLSPPTDIEIVNKEIVIASERISGYRCSFNAMNNGLFSLLSKTTHCAKFFYVIYANKQSQSELINAIKKSQVPALFIDRSYDIDSRKISDRLPDFYEFLIKNFPNQENVGNYTLIHQ